MTILSAHERPPSRLLGLLSQLGAAVLSLVLLGLSAGDAGSGIFTQLDGLTIALLLVWLVSAFMVSLAGWARDPERPDLRLGVGLVPLVAGVAFGGLSGGEGALGQVAHGQCSFVMAFGFAGGRLQVLGILASASLWLGMLPCWLSAGGRLAAPSSEDGKKPALIQRLRPHMGDMAAVALWLVGAVWTLLDPFLPSKAAVGGQAVLKLWWLMAALPLLMLWARFVPAMSDAARSAALAAPLGFGLLGLAIGLLPRLVFLSGGSIGFEETGGLVVATAWLRMAPSLLLALSLGLVVAWAGAGARFRRRVMGLGLACLVVVLLGVGQEMQLRQGLADTCEAPLAKSLELPHLDLGPESAPGAVWILPQSGVSQGAPPSGQAHGLLGLAADRRLATHSLLDHAQLAAWAGWPRFALLHDPPRPDEARCKIEQRLFFGLCPSRRRDTQPALIFELPRPIEHSAVEPGQVRLMVNVLADRGKLALSLGGYGPGTEPERLEALGGTWRHDAAGLDSMARALRKLRQDFPQSDQVFLVVDGQMPLARLSELVKSVARDPLVPGRLMFPRIVLDRSAR